MTDIDESAVLAADILSEIVTYIQSSRPRRTDGGQTQGVDIQFHRPGRMVSPRDLGYPWSPFGGVTAPKSGGIEPPKVDGAASPEQADAVQRAVSAAFNTMLVTNTRFTVTDDGTLGQYAGGGKEVAATYADLLASMEALPAPPRSAAEEERIAEAKAVLWDEDMVPTEAYERYLDNQREYSQAQGNYTTQSVRLVNDPATAEFAPLMLRPYLTEVDQAWHQWKSQGAEEIEEALATVESLGVPLEQGAIAAARQRLADWTIPLLGVSTEFPYTLMLPSEWAVPDVDDIGWTTLERTESETRRRHSQHGYDPTASPARTPRTPTPTSPPASPSSTASAATTSATARAARPAAARRRPTPSTASPGSRASASSSSTASARSCGPGPGGTCSP